MTKVHDNLPEFLKPPTIENGCFFDQYQNEARNPLRTDVIRCPWCNSRDLVLTIEHHYKSTNTYHLKCYTCQFYQKNPFPSVWAYCEDDPKCRWIAQCIAWAMEWMFE